MDIVEVQDRIDALKGIYSLRHPGAARWYGVRGSSSSKKVVCYVCDEVLGTFSGRYSMTKRVQNAVQEHLEMHLASM